MAISILDPLVQKQGDTRKSGAWYRQAVASIADKARAGTLMRKGQLLGRPSGGRLNLFFYDPKFKKTLPYYDTFPLVLPIDTFKGGFLGINLHYLPINLRIRLLDRLIDDTNNVKFDATTKIVADYQSLKNVRLIKPALKKYLAGKVQSKFRRIDADEFTIAALLPVARFKKASIAQVHRDSRGMI